MRFGLIGTGLMAQEHLRNLQLLPEAELVSLADPAPASLDWARRTLGDRVPPAAPASPMSDPCCAALRSTR